MKSIRSGSLYPLAIAIVSTVPGLVLSARHVSDGFLYQVIAYVRLTLSASHLAPFTRGGYSFGFIEFLPGYPMVISILARFSGISPEALQFLPIGAVLLPLSYFALCKSLFRSNALAAMLALYVAYDVGFVSHYNIFAYSWSNVLYIAFLSLCLRLPDGRRPGDLLLIILVYAGSMFIHYTATLWMVVSSFSLYIILKWGKGLFTSIPNASTRRWSLALPAALLVSFLTFSRIFYDVWLPSAALAESSSGPLFELTVMKLASYLRLGGGPPGAYMDLSPWGTGFGTLRLLEYAIILLPTTGLCGKLAWSMLRRKQLKFHSAENALLMAIILPTAVLDLIAYGVHSGVNTRFIMLTFPLLAFIALDESKVARSATVIYGALLASTAVAAFYIGLGSPAWSPRQSSAQARSATLWLLGEDEGGPVLSDLETVGLLLVAGASTDLPYPRFLYYDSRLYDSVVNPQADLNASGRYRFLIVDARALDRPLHGVGNSIYDPIALHVGELRANPRLREVYDDGNIWIFEDTSLDGYHGGETE